MFAGFNLRIDDSLVINNDCYLAGWDMFEQQKKDISLNLKEIVYKNDYIDGTALQDNWFPSINADIFLSHSHMDEDLAISIAGWLHKSFGLITFIDSCVWGYSDKLQRIIDNKYCAFYRDEKKSYDYNKRNYTTSHVHMMLSISLSQMIDRTECLFFLNTPKSLILSDNIEETTTASPWIYFELQQSSIVRHKRLNEYRTWLVLDSKERHFESAMKIKYDVKLDHLVELSSDDLIAWEGKGNFRESALDSLYEYKGILPVITR